eukprot:IDg2705t1
MRAVNHLTDKHAFPMPNVEHELHKLAKAVCYSNFDFSHAYWQLPLAKESQECQSFITPFGVFTPTRVLHERQMHPQELIGVIGKFLEICHQYNLKVHPKKCELYATSVRWCGRVISPKGIRFDPARLTGLLEMPSPKSAANLQQFLCAMQWMRTAVPQFQELTKPLHEVMEKAYSLAGKRTKRAAAKIALSTAGWTEMHDKAFTKCKTALANQLAQVPLKDLTKPFEEQCHEPLGFLSGRFDATQFSWKLSKRSLRDISELRAHEVGARNTGCWCYAKSFAMGCSTFMVQLCMLPHKRSGQRVGRSTRALGFCTYCQAPRFNPSSHIGLHEDFEWPTLLEISKLQQANSLSQPKNLIQQDGILRTERGAIWVPEEAEALQLRIYVIAHTSAAGHRGIKSTLKAVSENFIWATVKDDIGNFVRGCLHCICTTTGKRIPRPFGPAFHGLAPNDLLPFDFLEMTPSVTGAKYILILRDDFSSFIWMYPFPEADAHNAADAIIDWSASFSTPKALISDRGTHFKNETVRLITKALYVPHHFTLPQSRGRTEKSSEQTKKCFCGRLAPVTIFTGQSACLPLSVFRRASTGDVVSLRDAKIERMKNLEKAKNAIDELHAVVQQTLKTNRERARVSASRSLLPNFTIDKHLDEESVFPHVLYSERGMPVQRLMNLEDTAEGLQIRVRWRGLSAREDTLEPLQRVYEDAPALVRKIANTKINTSCTRSQGKICLGSPLKKG